MKLEQILTERAMHTLFHVTSIVDAHSIIRSRQFKLSANTEAGDNMKGDAVDREVNHYFLSTARSTQSAYFDDMMTEAEVILVLSGTKLAQRYKLRPHVNQDARMEMGPDYNEMEERIFSNSPILNIPQPINQTILAVHCVNLMDEFVYARIANPYVKNRASPQALYALNSLCLTNNIPIIRHENLADMRLMRDK